MLTTAESNYDQEHINLVEMSWRLNYSYGQQAFELRLFTVIIYIWK